ESWALYRWIIERPGTLEIHSFFNAMMENDPRAEKNINPEMYNYVYFADDGTGKLTWARPNAEVPLICLAEVYFIQAEAMLQLNDSKTEVADMLRKAITASMELMELNSEQYQTYVDQHAVLAPNNTFEEDLEIIIAEAYKAYFAFNCREAWANHRRTGYPVLPTPNPDLMRSVWNPSGGAIQRFLYPQSEFDTNREAVERAEAAQDGALLDDPLWIFTD
ncbi:MAG: SusD/RagB family nutrient-binding outer membrane lipoprotein, partial [Bacteroidota bacterium]